MKKYAGLTALLLALLLLLSLSACGKDGREPKEADPGTYADEYTPSPEEVKALWEGVYDGQEGVAVIRNAENGSLDFSLSINEISLSGAAEIDGASAAYSENGNGILFAVSDNKLLLEFESGEEKKGSGFFVIFTRNDEDPYTYVIVREDTAEKSPKARFDITATTVYDDPKGRFTVTLPDIFDVKPIEAQPVDGVYMQTDDGSVYVMVETMKKVASTEQDLVDYLDSLGILAAVRPDGMVVYSKRFADGMNDPWAEFAFLRILSDVIVKIDYVCAEEYYDECSKGCGVIAIDELE